MWKWAIHSVKSEFSKDNLLTTLLIFAGITVFVGFTYVYVAFIHWLGFYGTNAVAVGLLLLLVLGGVANIYSKPRV